MKRYIDSKPIKGEDFSVYKRKTYLFDTNSEFNLYKILLELYSDKYFIFPQINYSHLIEPKKASWSEERSLRSRIDRKSADFVICDKEKIIPCLIIELDGSAHFNNEKQKRDRFIDKLTESVGIPILHIVVGNISKDSIREKIDTILRHSDLVDSNKQAW